MVEVAEAGTWLDVIGFSKRIPCPLDHHHPTPHVSYRFPLTLIMAHEESISLEETNKHRIALGLKPLTDDKAPVDSAEKRAEDNYAKQREKEAQDKEKKYVYPLPSLASSLSCSLFHLSEGSRIK